jgi:predicted permease
MHSFFRKLRWLTQRPIKEADLQEELQFHLEEEAETRQAAGTPAAQARLAARRELGNLALVQENTRAAWGWTLLEQFLQDCRYAVRTMSDNKVFTALAILSLALGIGANTAIYSFMDALLLRGLPVADPGSLVMINWQAGISRMRGSVIHSGSGTMHSDGKHATVAGIFPYPAFELMQKSGEPFSSVFAYYPVREVNLMWNGQAERAYGEYVSGDYFRGLAVPPAAGRIIVPDDDRAGAPPVAVLSFAYARHRFDDVARAPGQSILINNVAFQIAGVAAPGFFGVDPAEAPDFYVPLHANFLLKSQIGNLGEEYLDQNYYWIEMMARLRPGVSLAQAQATLAPIFHNWVDATAANQTEREHLPSLWLREGATGLDTLRYQYSKPLYVLLGMVALILAIACANIANLLLARAAARRREIAVRISIGAGRFRVIRQLLTESVMLASIGGAIGVLFAIWGIRFLTFLLANGNERFTLHPDLNLHVLGAAIALSLLTGIVFGLAPALQSTRVDVMPALKLTRGGEPRTRHPFSRALIVSQIAISLLLLVGAGLFMRTLNNLQSIQLGFNHQNLLLFQMNARQAGHKDPEIIGFYSTLLKQFAAIPGVSSATATHQPLLGRGTWMGDALPVGRQPLKTDVTTHILMTGPDFFSTLQIPILYGRGIDDRDRAGSLPVAVVNEAYVKTNFGDENPLGRHIVVGRRQPFKPQDVEIVGIAKNAKYGSLTEEGRDIVYLSFAQSTYYPVDEMTFMLRTTGDPLAHANTVREIVRRADARVPVVNIKTEAGQLDQIMNQQIIFARLCTGFASLALVIACVGLYGTMTYKVARRTGEIGIRMALGAQRNAVVWMVLREVCTLAAIGLAISVPIALFASKVLKSFLFDVKPNDPGTLTLAVSILLAAALLAGYVPAWRASRIDPMTALRHE